jgi:hypothetical protein
MDACRYCKDLRGRRFCDVIMRLTGQSHIHHREQAGSHRCISLPFSRMNARNLTKIDRAVAGDIKQSGAYLSAGTRGNLQGAEPCETGYSLLVRWG